MIDTIHLFFNGAGVLFPRGNAWEKFKELDAARTFAICAESWRRQGWNVCRLSTALGDFRRTPFSSSGECSKSFHWYPEVFWQFIAKAKTVAESGRLTWFGTIDVINYGFRPGLVVERSDPALTCVNLQTEHESLACFAATREWLEEAERILLRYDAGELAALPRDYTSDETILRNYAKFVSLKNMIMACNTEAPRFSLLHFARTTLRPIWEAVPLSGSPAAIRA